MTLWCVGKNYSDHIQEMGSEPRPTSPLIFQKSGGTVLQVGNPIPLPKWSNNVHHELELAFLLNENLEPSALALALDLTARDHQTLAKSNGWPWSLGKSFKNSCPIAPWLSLKDPKLTNWPELEFTLKVGDEVRQRGRGRDMLFSLPEILDFLLERFPLEPGDAVLTGTPSGVGPLSAGDELTLSLEGFQSWHWHVSSP